MISQDAAERARSLHQGALVVDGHVDTLLQVLAGERRLGERSDKGHVDLPRLSEGGVDVQFFACYSEPEHQPDRGPRLAMRLIDAFWREIEANPDRMMPVLRAEDMETARKTGKLGAVLAIEGGAAIGDDLAILRNLHRLGLRSLGLVWNFRNLIADGMGEARTHGGLTTFGVDVVKECNRLGIIVDVSHLTEEGFWDVLATSTKPIVATHSDSRAVCDHPRNLTDDQVRALAKNGGLMGMNFATAFLDPDKATLASVVKHIDHLVELVGPDHVGLGSDFDGIPEAPEGLEDVTKLPRLTEALLRAGYGEDDVRKILGLNFLRVFREVVG